MIKRLLVKNLAIIRELEVPFAQGLNMITGETGSGKSILIEAIALLLGGRAPSDIIRTGEDTAVVEGEFVSGQEGWLIRRVIRGGGASRIFLNDEPIKLADLETFANSQVDLHGQHEHQSLLRISTHLDFLDAYAGLLPDREVLSHTYHHLIEVNKELKQLTERHAQEQELHELHQFQLKELETADLSKNEEEELDKEYKLLSQAEELHRLLTTLEQRLQKDEESIASEVAAILKRLDHFVELAPELASMGGRLSSLKVELEDLAFESMRFGATLKPDPKRMAEIETRLGELEAIKRKYGGTLETALEQLHRLKESVSQYTASDAHISQLQQEQGKLREAYAAQCRELSRQRRAASGKLEADIIETLHHLDMPDTRFEVRFENKAVEGGICVINGQGYQSDDRGYDQVEFYISPNPGEDLRPLAKIASGGEISRMMLGIKSVLAAYDPVACLIFDEIDNGISGSTAETVGIALQDLADSRQVICITHLPQIAARGDHHLSMEKLVKGGRTLSRMRVVTGEERRREIARLLSGAEITQASMDQASRLLSVDTASREVGVDG